VKQPKRGGTRPPPASADLTLPEVFPENASPASPLFSTLGAALPSLDVLEPTPLPRRNTPPRFLLADDERGFFEALQRSLDTVYPGQLDLRFWSPNPQKDLLKKDLLTYLRELKAAGWRPDAVIIDINFDDGGRHGVDYLRMLREEPGCTALPVVLTTGNQLRDLEEDRLSGTDRNWTGTQPSRWLTAAESLEPEGILYGKAGIAAYLGRIAELLDDWRRTARRRAWVRLLRDVAGKLDGPAIKVEKIALPIVKFAVDELGMEAAFVRQRQKDDKYSLMAHYPEDYPVHREVLGIGEVPFLHKIVGQHREVVVQTLTEDDVGATRRELVGQRLLGVGCVLGERNVGFITMLPPADTESFFDEIDRQYIHVLARLLASGIRVSTLRDRQTELLNFAIKAGTATDRDEVCTVLARLVHNELHQADNANAKVTVRLLDSGTGDLERKAHIGLPAKPGEVYITSEESVYARVVRDNQATRIEDMREVRAVHHELDGEVRSELCVPLSIGGSAIGAVNLEHRQQDFYRAYDEEFVNAAAALAANAIARIRTAQVLEGMTNFVHQFATEKTDTLNARLRKLLYKFCGYSVLVDLAPSTDGHGPWAVQAMDCRLVGADEERVRKQIDEGYRDDWAQTWVGKRFLDKDWRQHWARYTDQPADFHRIMLTEGMSQRADAVLWLRAGDGDDSPPHQAILLMWALPPPLNKADRGLFDRIARLFSELYGHQANIKELMEQKVIGEEAALVGHVMQHFRHRLGSLTGGMANHIARVDRAFANGDRDRFADAMANLRANAQEIADSFDRSRGYVKKVEPEAVPVTEIVQRARRDLADRLARVEVDVRVPSGLLAWTDPEIAALVLFSLLQNALDATKDQGQPRITITAEADGDWVRLWVADSGPGVSEAFRPRLFQWGQTTKTGGLGSALAFARARMRLLQGDLIFPTPQPDGGALFEMRLAHSIPET